MSATRSTSGGSPYLNPKLMIVSVCRAASSSEKRSHAASRAGGCCTTDVSMMTSALSRTAVEPLALVPDAVEDRAVALERMRAPDRLEPSHEHVVGGIQEHQPDLAAGRAAPA